MNGPNSKGFRSPLVWIYLLALAAAAAEVLVWRLDRFALLEPIIDPAFHIQWV